MFNATELSIFLINHITEGILLFNHDLDIVYANKQVQDMLGLGQHDIVGKSANRFLNGAFMNNDGILSKAIEKQQIIHGQMDYNGKKMQLTAYSFKGSPDEPSHKILIISKDSSGASPTNIVDISTEQLSKEEVEPEVFGKKLVANVEDLAEAKNIPVEFRVKSSGDPLFIQPEKMEVALMHLLSKAINFSDQGKIEFIIDERESGNAHLIRITNAEEKIPADDYDALINSFSKGTDKAKNIVEAHGGKLWIETDPGFSIVFSLPKNLI